MNISTEADNTIPIEINITSEMLNTLRLKSCSRANFCVNLARQLFSVEERQESNVKGRRGKKRLNEAKMKVIETNAFHVYPLATGEHHHLAWRLCEKAVDESCRRLNRRVEPYN